MEIKTKILERVSELRLEIVTANTGRLIEICLTCIETTEEIIKKVLKRKEIVPKQRIDFENRLIKLQRIKPVIITESNEEQLRMYATASIEMIETITNDIKK